MIPAEDIPEVVVERLPQYIRALSALRDEGVTVVNSRTLGERLSVTPAQIRKDLSHFGRFGTQGRGYQVADLLDQLRSIVGLDRQWTACVVGTGRLGAALVEYRGFAESGINVCSAFDIDPSKVGIRIGNVTVRHVDEMEAQLRESPVHMAILAVPAAQAQPMTDRLVAVGVRAMVNYAPASLRVPAGVMVRQIDPVMPMQTITFYMTQELH